MRALLVTCACTLPTVAHADERCEVTYVNVPDGIREVVESWVAAEPHCRGAIALRVIPTKDGLFVFGERPDGTVHERLVPDLTAAGVLVASWVADSWTEIPRKKKRAKRREIAVRAVAVSEATQVDAVVERPARHGERKRWLSLGAAGVIGAVGTDLGFRLETDMFVLGGWKLGVVAQKMQDQLFVYTTQGMTVGSIDDWSTGVTVSRTLRWGGWELRGAAGVSLLGSRAFADDYSGGPPVVYTYHIAPSPAYELSATLGRDIGDRWGIALTLAATMISQTWSSPEETVLREQTLPTWAVSLRRRI